MKSVTETSPSRKSIHITPETHQKFSEYSKLTGVPLQTVVARALADWMETTGTVHMEVWAARMNGKPVSFDGASALPPAASNVVQIPATH